MKPTHRTLILAALIAATGLIVYHFTTSPHRNGASEPAGTPSTVEGQAESVVTARPAKENRAATTASNRPAPEVIPDGIGEEEWKRASAMFTMMTAGNGEAMMSGVMFQPKDVEAMTKALGFDASATSILNKLTEARNDALKKIGAERMDRFKREATATKEWLAFSMMPEEKLTVEQHARLDQLKQQKVEDQKDFIKAMVPWFKDDSLLASIHDQLPADNAAAFDDYAKDQLHKLTEQMAFSHSRALNSNLELDESQRQAVFEVYRNNESAGNDDILPLLNESQQAKLKEHPQWGDWSK
jgi:hypothetical protein